MWDIVKEGGLEEGVVIVKWWWLGTGCGYSEMVGFRAGCGYIKIMGI